MPLKPNLLPDRDVINSLFEYKDGVLLNKVHRKQSRAGNEAGFLHKGTGYRRVKIDGKPYSVHRVIFFMQTGLQPEMIDHANGNPLDNKIENLRVASRSENMYNRKLNANNKSGVKGLRWVASKNKWVASIAYNSKLRTIGHFNTKELAAEFLELARDLVHGEYANHGTFRSI
jgi:hypothetical protein